jgi:hypothetical protein
VSRSFHWLLHPRRLRPFAAMCLCDGPHLGTHPHSSLWAALRTARLQKPRSSPHGLHDYFKDQGQRLSTVEGQRVPDL